MVLKRQQQVLRSLEITDDKNENRCFAKLNNAFNLLKSLVQFLLAGVKSLQSVFGVKSVLKFAV
jgi:hypothetical protein